MERPEAAPSVWPGRSAIPNVTELSISPIALRIDEGTVPSHRATASWPTLDRSAVVSAGPLSPADAGAAATRELGVVYVTVSIGRCDTVAISLELTSNPLVFA